MTTKPIFNTQTFLPRQLKRLLRHSYAPPVLKELKGGVTGKCTTTGGSGPWTVAEIRLLGTVPDKEAARKLGRTEKAVGNKRQSLGIAAIRLNQRVWTAPERLLLGRVTDAEAARRLNRSLKSVTDMRRKLGLAALHSPHQPLVKGPKGIS